MGAATTKALADLRHRPVQAVVLAAVLALSSGTGMLAANILVASRDPFAQAFAQANGAHVVVEFAPSVAVAAIRATADASPVTAMGGPWPVATAGLGSAGGGRAGGLPVSGRPQPDGTIDRVVISDGRWWQGPGEAVIGRQAAAWLGIGVGQQVDVYREPGPAPGGGPGLGGGPRPVVPGKGTPPAAERVATVRIVGVADSVSTPDVALWAAPDVVGLLASAGGPAQQALYRVEPSASAADLATAVNAITGGLAADAVVGTSTYLEHRADVDDTASLYVPVLVTFALLALAAAAFAIASIVSGVVLTAYRDIGVMKAVGFTPTQVTSILLAQVMVPVAVGTSVGVIAGALLSLPTVADMTHSFGLPGSAVVAPEAVVAVVLACLVTATLAAIGPARQAGRIPAAAAIAQGGGPRDGRPGRLRRLALRLTVADPVRLGIAAGATHPVRTTMTLGALLVGVAAATFALSLNLTLLRVVEQLDRAAASPVRVDGLDPSSTGAAVTGAIDALPGTARVVAAGEVDVAVRTLGSVPLVGYEGDATWLGYELIAGRWFAGPGEVVAPTRVFEATGLHIGDALELAHGGRTATVRLVGEVFDTADGAPDGLLLRGTWADLATLDPALQPTMWEVAPVDGVSPHALQEAIDAGVPGAAAAWVVRTADEDEGFLLFLSVVATLGLALVVISLGGVANTVLLETHRRTRELALLKALGLEPRGVVETVAWSVIPAGLVAGLVGVPVGLAASRLVLTYLADLAAHLRIPEHTFDVLPPPLLAALAATGLLLAITGALGPALRAARSPIAPVLQAE